MRELTAAATAWLAQPVGNEPINILAISWIPNVWNYYVDTNYGELTAAGVSPTIGIHGLILELSNLESLPDLDGSGSSQSISVTLDDTSGAIKAIMDNFDIHKRPVKVAQWFKGMEFADSFILFEGQVSTPIIWSEGDRKLKFDIVSILESREVGYSIEEGAFDYAPPNLIGRAWPYIMGTAFKVPSIRIQDIPKGVTSDKFTGSSSASRSNNSQAAESNNHAMNEALYNSQIAFGHAQGLRLARPDNDDPNAGFREDAPFIADYELRERVGKFGDADVYSQVRHIIRGTKGALDRQEQEYVQRGNEYLLQAQQAGQASQSDASGATPGDSAIAVANGNEFPQNVPLTATLNGRTYTGTFSGNIFHLSGLHAESFLGVPPSTRVSLVDDSISTQYLQYVDGNQEFVVDGGSRIFIGNGSGFGVDYIACLDACTVLGVYAERTFDGGVSQLWPVPSSYYTVSTQNFGPNLGNGSVYDDIIVTKINMSTPLSSRTGPDGKSEGWSDDIFCDLVSPYGANPVIHIKILIQRYTNVGWEEPGFTNVQTIQENYPIGCAILERKDVLTVLKEMAFQMRCNIRYNNGKFYLKYLPINYPFVDTITNTDVERASLEITCEPTENLVTKLSAKWRLDYSGKTERAAIYRHNIIRYGTHAQDYDFWMYNIEANVHKSAVFWMIRKSNTYKKIKFNTFMTKLALEANDYVHVTIPESHDGTIVGMVESCIYDSSTSKVTMEIWLPVRFGERVEYIYAMPADLPSSTQFPSRQALHAGEAGTGSLAGGTLVTQGTSYYNSSPARSPSLTTGRNFDGIGILIPPTLNFGPSDVGNVPQAYTPTLNPGDINRTINTGEAAAAQPVKVFNVKPCPPPRSTNDIRTALVFPGIVRSHDVGNFYNVDAFVNGIDNPARSLRVRQIGISDDDTIDVDTPCMVFTLSEVEQGQTVTKYYMQVPVWAGPET